MDPSPSSRPVSHTDWDKQVYIPESDLEVVPRTSQPYNGLEYNPNPPHGYGIECSPTSTIVNGIECNFLPPTEEKIAAPTKNNLRRDKICGLRRNWFFLLLAAIAVSIIAAAVGGAVGAKQGNKSSSSSGTGPQSPGTDPNPASNSTSPTTKGISTNSSLATIAYNNSMGIMQYRLYYQDENDMIKESAWNETGKQWYVSHVGIAKAMPGTPIAAAVRAPPLFDFRTNIFYLSPSTTPTIQEYTTADGTTWSPGPLSQSDTVTPSPSTHLTAKWHSHSFQDPNTLLVIYQDASSMLHLLNRTDTGTTYTTTPLSANASPSASLSIALSWNGDYQTGLKLYYRIAPSQPAAGKLGSLHWRSDQEYSTGTVFAQLPAPPATAHGWQNRESLPLPGPSIPALAPTTAFSRGTTPAGNSTPYKPQQIQILTSTSTGEVSAITWLGRNGGSWFPAHSPASLGSEKAFSPLAANEDGALFTIGNKSGRVRCFKANHDGLTYGFQGYVL